MKKLFLMALIALVPVYTLPQKVNKTKTDFGKVRKALGYLSLSAICGYLSVQAYVETTRESGSDFTKNLILYIHKIYDKTRQQSESRVFRPLDSYYMAIAWDTFNEGLIEPEMQEKIAISKAFSIATGGASLFFGYLGLRNVVQAYSKS